MEWHIYVYKLIIFILYSNCLVSGVKYFRMWRYKFVNFRRLFPLDKLKFWNEDEGETSAARWTPSDTHMIAHYQPPRPFNSFSVLYWLLIVQRISKQNKWLRDNNSSNSYIFNINKFFRIWVKDIVLIILDSVLTNSSVSLIVAASRPNLFNGFILETEVLRNGNDIPNWIEPKYHFNRYEFDGFVWLSVGFGLVQWG